MTELPIDDNTLEDWLSEMGAKRARIKEQSKDVTNYIASNVAFYEWFDALEGFHIREERFWDDCERGDADELFSWIRAAFHVGYEAGRVSRTP